MNGRFHKWRKALRIAGITLGSLLLLVILTAGGITLWLTPSRLSRIAERQASEYFNADFSVGDIEFTLWSSFPRLAVNVGPITVVSRNLRDITPEQRAKLPSGCDSLASASGLRGSINILRLAAGDLYLSNIEVDSLRLNIVALDDSLNNYDILPETTDESFRIPYFSTNYARLKAPQRIDYFSAATQTRINAVADSASMRRQKGKSDSYTLKFNGHITAKVDSLTLLRDFPFELDGDMGLAFHPFSLRLSDYTVALGNTRGHLNMKLALGRQSQIDSLTYKIDTFDLMRLLDYMPERRLPYLSGLDADISLTTSARLVTPYRFSSTALPSLEVDFDVDGGKVDYTLSERETYSLSDIGMSARLFFDGRHPDSSRFSIYRCSLGGEGTRIDLQGTISDLTGGNPLADLRLQADADLTAAGRSIGILRAYSPHGRITTDTRMRFRISDATRSGLTDICLNGKIRLDTASLSPAAATSVSARHLEVNFTAAANRLSDRILENGMLAVKASADMVSIKGNACRASLRGLAVTSRDDSRHTFVFSSGAKAPLMFQFDMQAAGATLDMPDDTLHIEATGMTGINRFSGGEANARLRARCVSMRLNGTDISVCDANLSGNFSLADTLHDIRPDHIHADTSPADRQGLATAPHSPEYLVCRLPEKAADFFRHAILDARLRTGGGKILSRAFPQPVTLEGLDISTDLDTLTIHRLGARSGISAFSLSARADNLRRFLGFASPQRLGLDLTIDIDTLGINNLAHVYKKGIGTERQSASQQPPEAPDSTAANASDNVALLIPRNIDARIKASAKETVYTNLHLYDLGASIGVADGKADISHLRISSDFGHADLSLLYDTSDIEMMRMKLALAIKQIDVTRFFENFHTLLLMMPAMKNLSGYVSAECEGDMLLFPDMNINVPSLRADVSVQGRQLKVHQNHFIRRITKMMFIRTSRDIHIANINAHATVHDNLLTLYPFRMDFDRYRLRIGGLNNFNGRLHYQIGVLDSPVPFPFGINISGMFHNPELRFGGAGLDPDKGLAISSSIEENNQVNLVKELRHYLRVFIDTAAKADTIPGFSL